MVQKSNLKPRCIQNVASSLSHSLLYSLPPLTGKFLTLTLWFILLFLDKCYPTLHTFLHLEFFVCFDFVLYFGDYSIENSSIEKYFSFLFTDTLYSIVKMQYNYNLFTSFLVVDIWVVSRLYHRFLTTTFKDFYAQWGK